MTESTERVELKRRNRQDIEKRGCDEQLNRVGGCSVVLVLVAVTVAVGERRVGLFVTGAGQGVVRRVVEQRVVAIAPRVRLKTEHRLVGYYLICIYSNLVFK